MIYKSVLYWLWKSSFESLSRKIYSCLWKCPGYDSKHDCNFTVSTHRSNVRQLASSETVLTNVTGRTSCNTMDRLHTKLQLFLVDFGSISLQLSLSKTLVADILVNSLECFKSTNKSLSIVFRAYINIYQYTKTTMQAVPELRLYFLDSYDNIITVPIEPAWTTIQGYELSAKRLVYFT